VSCRPDIRSLKANRRSYTWDSKQEEWVSDEIIAAEKKKAKEGDKDGRQYE
jgi:hypothetical protein